jgi:hypothetical protein
MLILYVIHYDRLLGRVIILTMLLLLMLFVDFYITHQSQSFIHAINRQFKTVSTY